mgnify:FL=1
MPSFTAAPRALVALIFAVLVGAAACTPQHLAQIQAEQTQLASHRSSNALDAAQLARLAKCESGGNPAARSKSGKYRGLYQFDQRTWNGVASSVLPSYVGVSPDAAPSYVQDAMARALFDARGRAPWPVCGKRI